MAKKVKNVINVENALLELRSADFEVEEFNYYQFRIKIPGTPKFWDWYHTTGSLVESKMGGWGAWYQSRDGTFLKVEELVKHLSKKLQ